MATDRLGLEQPDFDTPGWEIPLNENFERIDSKLARAHEGNPNGEIKPDYIGQTVWDTTNGRRYVAHGENDNQWVIDSFDPGTSMVFLQESAPVGWVQSIAVNDRLLRLVSGEGKGVGGQWEITGIKVHGHAVTVNQMPSHDHGGGNHGHIFDITKDNDGSLLGSTRDWLTSDPDHVMTHFSGGSLNNSGRVTESVRNSGSVINSDGGGNAHDHGVEQSGNWRPSYQDVIVAEKMA